ncbi:MULTISPECIES: glutathione S-transferase family protein [unclassified Sinorhizobium]|uniref:glutathione S-transferase family protein n=1 Tax=unclassified Sinorhizobium TaxID=2613772 RepID=UPI0035267F7E
MPTLCYMPRTCAIGIHIILEEIGKPYDLKLVDLRKHAHLDEEYIAINPKSKVPALIRDDGSVLTEFPAIATWLALMAPERNLLPQDPEKLARALEMVDYVVATLHMQGWSRHWRPQHHSSIESEHPAIQAKGRDIIQKGLALLDGRLETSDWLIGAFSIADCALFYIEYWSADVAKWSLPTNIAVHYSRMKQRASVQRMASAEGIAELSLQSN